MTIDLLALPHHEQRPICSIDHGALTANGTSYLSGFRTADDLRNRAAKAAEENDLRLRAKSFQLEARPALLNQEGEG